MTWLPNCNAMKCSVFCTCSQAGAGENALELASALELDATDAAEASAVLAAELAAVPTETDLDVEVRCGRVMTWVHVCVVVSQPERQVANSSSMSQS